MRVLLSAYACEPGRGSEPGMGWNWVQQIARFHDVWVLTQEGGHQAIKAAPTSEALARVRFVYVDLPHWALFWKKGRRGIQVHYYLWQLAAYFVGRRLHRKVRFDLVHHVTLGKYWMPSFLALLPIPFIWGPVGGGESAPGAFRRCFSSRGKLYEVVRDVARSLGQMDPFVRLTAQRAPVGLAATEETAARLRKLGCRNVTVLSQVALPGEEIAQLGGFTFRQGNPFRLVSVGQLLHLKAFQLSVRAFAEFHRQFPASEYWIVGDGPERKGLEELARQLGVAGKVKFWGWLPRPEVLQRLAECDVLIHPSLHESGGCVCLEAMAAGRPVICLDLGGLALQVNDETGIKVPAISPDQAVKGLAEALCRLAADSALCVQLGSAGRQRVRDCFDWNEKGRFLAAIYEGVVGDGSSCGSGASAN